MLNIFKKFLDYNQREINKIKLKVDEINKLEDWARKLDSKEIKEHTEKFKNEIKENKKTLDELLPHAFALVRETSRRILGQRHFDVQLIAGIALHQGKVAEQRTGEGKTLSATTSIYLNALSGKGVHLVTVNDYLARRDAGWMGGVFDALGLKTSAIVSDKSYLYNKKFEDKDVSDWRLRNLKPISRKEAYDCDITYGINSEFGFDYLRDNMAVDPANTVQRDFNFAIIDEADSVLIDEARTPHIISAPYAEDTSKYYEYAKFIKQLDPEKDFLVDEKSRSANLTEAGILHIEQILGTSNIYEKDFDALFHIEASLKAETLFKNNKEYIVKDGQVVIVDEFTGRLLEGRRFSEGIHQAIEAKENVSIQNESKTLATISLQNYFRKYKKLAGMTGTAVTEAEEFHKIYKADVLVIPTNMLMIRKDLADVIYKTESKKYEAIADYAIENYKNGRPVLIGTTSIEKNEHLSRIFTRRGVKHEMLNAKNHEREALIISKAGEKGSITVATNMAGRGVDIVLGGMQDDKNIKEWRKKHDEVVSLGGLCVIGTERHESRRIDNQLRGRSGRQGDPGETIFFVSLEDDLMRIFGGEQISKLMTFFKLPEDQPLTHPMVSKAIEQAQVKVEGFNFDIRKHLVDFDDVLNKQREIIYELRNKILILPEKNLKEFRTTILDLVSEEIQRLVNQIPQDELTNDDIVKNFTNELNLIFRIEHNEIQNLIKSGDLLKLTEALNTIAEKEYKNREKKYGEEVWNGVVRFIFLSTIDKYFTEHLTTIEDLREGIGLRGYAQLDPLVEYKNEAFTMFEKLYNDVSFEVIRRIYNVEINTKDQNMKEAEEKFKKEKEDVVLKSAQRLDPYNQNTKEEKSERKDLTTSKEKVGRNDPCWCGSGKKYKRCHYPD
ncbi:MAG: preprotein translocase subunit SecA [bacterium]|nr:preprotein translocase subunit SecA [bacterium]